MQNAKLKNHYQSQLQLITILTIITTNNYE